jgi:NADPH:quinone reductase-like Zn-dependent oxidoreductase
MLAGLDITGIDRRPFSDLAYDETRYETDRAYKIRYLQAEHTFLDEVTRHTRGQGVSIFVDNIGGPLFRATLRALGRLGVVTTAGWKCGKLLSYDRARACVDRIMFVHTHGCRHKEGVAAAEFAERTGWLPPADMEEYPWDRIPDLAADFAAGRCRSYFPVFQVNPL